MQKAQQLTAQIKQGKFDAILHKLYGDQIAFQKERYCRAIENFVQIFGAEEEICIVSAPGRTEIGGNHTDHNHGKVLAGSVDLDVIAVASPAADSFARIYSDKFPEDIIDLNDQARRPEEEGTSAALLRGIARRFDEMGFARGGVHAFTTSNVPKGSGVSSSAAFEVLLCSLQNFFYNEGKIPAIEIARISQYAERKYFGKPCGLMDQAACALGGISLIDFESESAPKVENVPFAFADSGYKLCLVAVGGDHADLTDAYAALPRRMKSVAAALGKPFLNEVTEEEVLENMERIRRECGDDAVLAALHFLRETNRVPQEKEALMRGDFPAFLELVTESGHSSFEYLQNVLVPRENASQGAALALCLASGILKGKGAWRIHGGGFGGTVQAFVRDEEIPAFREKIEKVFGQGACHVLSIRPVGPLQVM